MGYHPSSFLALCPVISNRGHERRQSGGGKAAVKAQKSVHALGLKPLVFMSREEATEVK